MPEPIITPEDKEKTVKKELFDKLSSDFASIKKTKAELQKELDKIKAENMTEIELAKAEAKKKEEELNDLKRKFEISELNKNLAGAFQKIGFDFNEKEFADMSEELNYNTVSNLINKISEIAYEKGKTDVTDSVMKKNSNLDLDKGKGQNDSMPEDVREAIEMAKSTASNAVNYDYYKDFKD